MAKIKLNSLLADMRGRMGSVVFSSNAAGFYASPLKTPIQPNTARQSSTRNTFSRLVKSWNLLSSTDRATWTAYAAHVDNARTDWFGDTYYPNARAQFVSVNTARLLAGAAIIETAPIGALPAVLPAMGAGVDPDGSGFTSYINALAAFDASIFAVHAAISLTSSPGRNTPITPYRVLGINPVSGTWPWEIDGLLSALYGVILETGTWWLALTPLSDEYRPGTTLFINAPMGQEYP